MNRLQREVYEGMTHAERQLDRRNRLTEIERELSDVYARIAALQALEHELRDERRQINDALRENKT